MNIGAKLVLAVATASAVISAKGKGGSEINLNLPTGVKPVVGYSYDLTAEAVYGTETPVTRTEKYVAGWLGDITASVAKTDKWYTDDESENWTVWTLEVCKGEDDAWFVIEIGK